ncbi:MAG: DUF2927 domain-containing protein [Xanthobacteraceae bacterium]|uniref:DUF2927 domain-containing protein n=1 Tax=Pseudolabrys sp. TaxID=1960880 RepID=UPI003D099AF8
MTRHLLSAIFTAALLMTSAAAFAASDKQSAPPGSFDGAPAQYTRFTATELTRGFLALAFGSDLSIGAKSKGVRRFTHDIRARVVSTGSVNRKTAVEKIIAEYAVAVPNLRLRLAQGDDEADITVRLIDEGDFANAIESAFGRETARAFVEKTDAQCMTSVRSDRDGEIAHSISFVIVDQGDDVFLDCAYHELLHAFGLSNHDDKNPWTMLNQERQVGYLTVYDRSLLTILYDPRIEPGLTHAQARRLLPKLIHDLGLADGGHRAPHDGALGGNRR